MSFSDCGLFVDCDSCSNEHLTGWYQEGSRHICFDCRPEDDDDELDEPECRGCGAPGSEACRECSAMGLV